MEPQILIVINVITPSIIKSVEKLRQSTDFKNLKIICMSNVPVDENSQEVTVLTVNFDDNQQIKQVLAPYFNQIVGVVCRGDGNIQYLRKLIDHLPPSVPLSSEASLAAATNKRLMREVFRKKCPELSPAFVQVEAANNQNIELVESVMKYPVIVKPANLMSSMLIQSCDTRSQLQKVLQETFSQITDIYEREGRLDKPQVIVEEFLQGEFYSIDAYVKNSGEVNCCPAVGYVSAKQLRIDDFYLYKRVLPSYLSKEEEKSAYEASAKVIAAIGLTHSSAHIELILTDVGWKIIEIGPRIGRFRNRMYKLSYGIDHSTNDISIHLGLNATIPNKLIAYTSCYSIYPDEGGILEKITGFENLKQYEAITHVERMVKDGSKCKQAKHGGKALAEITVSSKNKQLHDESVEYIETKIKAVVRPV